MYIKAELLDWTNVNIAVEASSMSRGLSKGSKELFEKIINEYGHESIAEHIYFNFKTEMSLLARTHLIRHRIASYTEMSTRYTLHTRLIPSIKLLYDEKRIISFREKEELVKDFFIIPDNNDLSEIYIQAVESFYNICEEILYLYESGYKNDVLKYYLPDSFKTRLVFSINLRSFRNFLNLRTSDKAHFEIRSVAEKMKNEVKKKTPYKNLV